MVVSAKASSDSPYVRFARAMLLELGIGSYSPESIRKALENERRGRVRKRSGVSSSDYSLRQWRREVLAEVHQGAGPTEFGLPVAEHLPGKT